MAKQSAGILLYRQSADGLQVFIVHPGGPFYRNKDEGAWSIPKGEFNEGEEALQAAKREFYEETGQHPRGDTLELKPVKLKSGKKIYAWAVEGDIDAENIRSNHFEIEWPPKSGRKQFFPEIGRAAWFDTETAKSKINPAQAALIDELVQMVSRP